MITTESIQYKANEWADSFDSNDPSFAKIKRMTAEVSFKEGANWAIQQMESDMKEFAEWCYDSPWFFTDGHWEDCDGYICTTDELLKKWREGKGANHCLWKDVMFVVV